MSVDIDPRISVLLHIHSYALSRALTSIVGSGQAFLARPYADSFVKL